MRHYLLTVAIVACSTISSIAQNSQFDFIVRPAIGSIRGELADRRNVQGKFAVTTGFGIGKQIGPRSQIYATFLWDPRYMQGTYDVYFKNLQTGTTAVVQTSGLSIELPYCSLPIEYRRRFGKKVIFEYGAGIYASYLAAFTTNHEYYYGYVPSPPGYYQVGTSENLKEIDLKNGDFGLSGSFRASYSTKERVLIFIAVDGNLGLVNINKADLSMRNQSFGVSFGVTIKQRP